MRNGLWLALAVVSLTFNLACGGGGGTTPPADGPFTLTVTAPSNGTIALSPSGGSYAKGTVVTVTATPASGYDFTAWTGALSGTTNPATVTMDADKTVGATFTLQSGGDECAKAANVTEKARLLAAQPVFGVRSKAGHQRGHHLRQRGRQRLGGLPDHALLQGLERQRHAGGLRELDPRRRGPRHRPGRPPARRPEAGAAGPPGRSPTRRPPAAPSPPAWPPSITAGVRFGVTNAVTATVPNRGHLGQQGPGGRRGHQPGRPLPALLRAGPLRRRRARQGPHLLPVAERALPGRRRQRRPRGRHHHQGLRPGGGPGGQGHRHPPGALRPGRPGHRPALVRTPSSPSVRTRPRWARRSPPTCRGCRAPPSARPAWPARSAHFPGAGAADRRLGRPARQGQAHRLHRQPDRRPPGAVPGGHRRRRPGHHDRLRHPQGRDLDRPPRAR